MLQAINRLLDNPSHVLPEKQDSFQLSLICLSSYIIKADGRILKSEVKFLLDFIGRTFGTEAADNGRNTLIAIFKQAENQPWAIWENKIRNCAGDLVHTMEADERQLLIIFLIKIIKADRHIDRREIVALGHLAKWLQIEDRVTQQLAELVSLVQ